jgi:hypothetical protein
MLASGNAGAQAAGKDPHIGYLYPAGAQRGTSVEVLAGGQAIGGASQAFVTGSGVQVLSVEFVRPLNNDQLKDLRTYVTGLMKALRTGQGLAPGESLPGEDNESYDTNIQELLKHPLLREINKMTLPELEHWAQQFQDTFRKQMNPQLAEMAVLQLAIAPDAAPGPREIRIGARQGLTNPLRFEVGTLAEVREHEPNDRAPYDATAVALPAVLNGQILPGDVDRFRVHAPAGCSMLVRTEARNLMPYLADAVPGWFQAAVTLYDAAGKEVAFADHYRFEPDPVLFVKVPEEGDYEVEIRDSIYRGRQDFVYRVSVGELPFVTRMSPLGGHEGEPLTGSIAGWNLPENKAALDTRPGEALRDAGTQLGCNWVPYAVDSLPEFAETEPNDDAEHAQDVAPPRIVNGCIGQSGDVDVFRVQGRANEEIVAEIDARKLNSPLDSLLRVCDATGKVIAWNDDSPDRESGLQTHHADSCVKTKLPADGTYFVRVSDTQHKGGEAYCYRLRVSAPRPDFALRATPSSINVGPGKFAEVAVHAIRKDGFDGDIEIALADAPAGFGLNGGVIPSGRDSVRMTLSGPPVGLDGPVELHFVGRAKIGEERVVRAAVPAEDMMQAFLWRQLVPSQQLLVATPGPKRGGVHVELVDNGPVRVPQGGSAEVRVRTPQSPVLPQVRVELRDAPKGISVEGPTVVADGLAIRIKAEADVPAVGYRDNLILEAFVEPPAEPAAATTPADPKSKPKQKGRASYGVLPAIPFEVVNR